MAGALSVRVQSLALFDRITAQFTVNLAGAINVSLDGYAGNLGDTFNVATATDAELPMVTGTFSTVNGSSINATLGFGTTYTSSIAKLIVLQKPAITNAVLTATGQVGSAFTPFTVTATGSPDCGDCNFDFAGRLELSSIANTISGTPLPGAEGVTNITLTATNSVGVDTKTLTLTINRLPVFTNPATASGTVESTVHVHRHWSGIPDPYTHRQCARRPDFRWNGFVISGTPTATGVTPVLLTAVNAAGMATQTLTITIGTERPAGAGLRRHVADSATDLGLNVTFTAVATPSPDQRRLTYTWDFGDGSATVTGDPVQAHLYH